MEPEGTGAGNIEIRPFADTDAEGVSALMTDLGYPATADEMRARIKGMLPDYQTTLVACRDARVIGFVGYTILPVYEYSQPIAWVIALSVGSGFRREGIGRALMRAAEEACRGRGVTDLRVHSGLQRGDAHVFYESMGYDKTGYRFKKSTG